MSTVWFEVPPARTPRHEAREKAAQLRERPNQWGMIRTYPRDQKGQRAAHNYASHIKNGRFPAFKGCDAYAQTVGEEVQVWARWLDGTETN